jgi:two-component system, NarL family, nitrate/nitrite response regulator NarL
MQAWALNLAAHQAMPVPLRGLEPPSGEVRAGSREMKTEREASRHGIRAVTGERAFQVAGRTCPRPRLVVVSPMRIYREGLAHVLAQEGSINVVGAAGRLNEMIPLLNAAAVDVVLFDLAVDGGLAALRRLSSYIELKVVVLGLSEDEGPIVACARAGIAGYVTPDATLQELTQRILEAAVGEFSCPPRVAATLLRSLAVPIFAADRQMVAARLTPRESEIIRLIERGMSNKEIARHLTIQLATVKNHVHNILEKLAVRDRAEAVRAARSIQMYPVETDDGLPALGFRS